MERVVAGRYEWHDRAMGPMTGRRKRYWQEENELVHQTNAWKKKQIVFSARTALPGSSPSRKARWDMPARRAEWSMTATR